MQISSADGTMKIAVTFIIPEQPLAVRRILRASRSDHALSDHGPLGGSGAVCQRGAATESARVSGRAFGQTEATLPSRLCGEKPESDVPTGDPALSRDAVKGDFGNAANTASGRTRRPLSLRECEQVPPAGFEPATSGLGNRCSIQLSYGGEARFLQGSAPVRIHRQLYLKPRQLDGTTPVVTDV